MKSILPDLVFDLQKRRSLSLVGFTSHFAPDFSDELNKASWRSLLARFEPSKLKPPVTRYERCSYNTQKAAYSFFIGVSRYGCGSIPKGLESIHVRHGWYAHCRVPNKDCLPDGYNAMFDEVAKCHKQLMLMEDAPLFIRHASINLDGAAPLDCYLPIGVCDEDSLRDISSSRITIGA